MSAPFLSLSENLALLAGAGTGKTHSLVSLALHLFGGARPSGEPLAPARLCAMTFTEKAAAELKERLRGRVRALAEGRGDEPDLLASFEAFGLPAPSRQHWEGVYAGLGGAFVGTFHAFCAQLVRRFCVEARLDPGFALLEEDAAAELFLSCAEQRLLRDLERGGEDGEAVRRLVRALGFVGRGEGESGLLELLARTQARLAEDGRGAESLPDLAPAVDFDAARAALVGAVRAALALPRHAGTDAACAALAQALPLVESCFADGALEALVAVKDAAKRINLTRCGREAKPIWKQLREDCVERFELACGDALEAPLRRDFVGALRRVEAAYRDEKDRRGALDFSDLVRRARDLLRDVPEVRLEAQARVGALLVDEFQDTNRVQLDLVALLAERREGAARPVAQGAWAELPLEPAMLACVGDRKQSIYEFRGADVSLLADVQARFAAGGGRVEYLQHNRRSRPALIRFCNALFAQVMQPQEASPPWRVVYAPEHDDLRPFRPPGPEGACAELLRVEGGDSGERREAEVDAIASRIAALLAPGAPPVVGRDREGAELRQARGGDVAILLRRLTHLDLFRRALVARSIPHVVIGGGGLFNAPEVVDLRSLLELIGDPSDRLALCAVLRSPFVGASDETLALLASARRLSVRGLAGGEECGLSPAEQRKLSRFEAAFAGLAAAAPVLGVADALDAAVEQLDFEAVLAGGFEGEQRIANVHALLAWARREEPPGALDAARRLRELAEREARKAPATLIEESDPRAVRLMTIHQSKGLEFPIVFVPDCGAGLPRDNSPVLFDRVEGLCLRPRADDGRSVKTSSGARVAEALASRQRAESERLFYVAATRARDYLVLSGEQGRNAAGGPTWRAQLDRFSEALEAGALLRVTSDASHLSDRSDRSDDRDSPGERAPSEPRIGAPAVQPRDVVAPVTELAELAVCPRKHAFLYTLGLQPPELPGEGKGRAEAAPLQLGTVVHAALERLDFGKAPEAQVLTALGARGLDPESDSARTIAEDVGRFATSELGRTIAALPPGRVWREVPFAVAVPCGAATLHLRGVMDLLGVLDDGSALVLDYKHGKPSASSAERNEFQMSCYALAARAALPGQVAVRTALVYLKQREAPEPRLRTDSELAAFRERLAPLARLLVARPTLGALGTLPEERCGDLRCAFRGLCHRGAAPASRPEVG